MYIDEDNVNARKALFIKYFSAKHQNIKYMIKSVSITKIHIHEEKSKKKKTVLLERKAPKYGVRVDIFDKQQYVIC